MEILAGIGTILGIVTGIWFLYDKAATINWIPFRPEPTALPLQTADAIGALWPPDVKPEFPNRVRQLVAAQLPGLRLPGADDITGEWGEYGNPRTLSPFFSEGSFSGKDKQECAFFVLDNHGGYRVIALTEQSNGDLQVHELSSGNEPPQRLFLRRVSPGRYRQSESAVQDGETARTVRLKRDGINVGMFESADSIFYWNQKKRGFDQVWMSD